MGFIHDFFDKQRKHFVKGGKWERYYFLYDAHETFLLTPKDVTKNSGAQIRDAIDMKRMMMTVIIAMIPCLLFGILNVGFHHFHAIGEKVGFVSVDTFLFGALKVLPIVAVSYIVGLGIEFIFATVRRHMVNEGFLVTGMLIPLVMPPDIPLWQVAIATAFAVIIGKEAFGGTGMNVLNVALTARAFLYFAYPSNISGDVWIAADTAQRVDGYSGATALAIANESVATGTDVVSNLSASFNALTLENLFYGVVPGSIGETSTLMALIGGVILVFTGIASWKIIVSVFAGTFVMGHIFNFGAALNKGTDSMGVLSGFSAFASFIGAILLLIVIVKIFKGEIKAIMICLTISLLALITMLVSGAGNAYMMLPSNYHLVIGGLAFGAVFMATDPVTATQTEIGKWVYGFFIGFLTVLIRVLNPAYPEGIMLAILFMNVMAPIIDHLVVQANKQRRLKRATV